MRLYLMIAPLAWLMAATVSPAAAQEMAEDRVVTTLGEALEFTHADNPRLRAERADLRASDERLVQSKAAFGPTLSVSGGYGYTSSRADQTAGDRLHRDGWSTTAQAILDQPLFSSGRLTAGRDISEAEVRFGRQSLRYTESQAMLAAIEAYVALMRDRELLAIARENADILATQLEEGTRRFAVREITRTDRDQISSQSALAQAGLTRSQGALTASLARFIEVTGALPAETLNPPPELPGVPDALGPALVMAEDEAPLVLAAEAREQASRAEIRRREGEAGPNVALGASARRAESPYAADLSEDVMRAEVRFDMPLFASGRLASRIREARELNDADWHRIDQAEREARAQIRRDWAELTTFDESLADLRAAFVASQSALEGGIRQQKAGDRSTQDVLELTRELLNARASLIEAEAGRYIAAASLLAGTGQLDPIDLLAPGGVYDPARNLEDNAFVSGLPPLSDISTLIDGLLGTNPEKPRPSRDAGVR